LNEAVNIAATGTANVAQATTIEAALNSGTTTIAALGDTATAVAGSSNAVLDLVTGTVVATGNATVLEANNLSAFTKPVVYVISDNLNALLLDTTGTTLNDAASIIVNNTAIADAVDMVNLDTAATPMIFATAATSMTGSGADLASVSSSINITRGNYSALVLGQGTVNQVNAIDAGNGNGIITATISDQDIATLNGLTGTGNSYFVTVATASVNAADLNALDGKTTQNVTATAVTTLTGTAADIAIAISSATINTAPGVGVTVDAGAVLATDLSTIDANTSAVVNATAVTNTTGTAAEIDAVFTNLGVSINVGGEFNASDNTHLLTAAQFMGFLGSSATLHVTDTIVLGGNPGGGIIGGMDAINYGRAASYGGNGTIVVGEVTTTGAYTIGMGASGNTTIILDGTGNHDVTMNDAAVTETIVLNATQDGGATLRGLMDSDIISISDATFTTAVANAGLVVGAGDYFYNAPFDFTATMTYWDTTSGAAVSLSLNGAGLSALTFIGGGASTFTV
jgi:hypothetical protein